LKSFLSNKYNIWSYKIDPFDQFICKQLLLFLELFLEGFFSYLRISIITSFLNTWLIYGYFWLKEDYIIHIIKCISSLSTLISVYNFRYSIILGGLHPSPLRSHPFPIFNPDSGESPPPSPGSRSLASN
jgi:hypothetical protein